MAQTVESNAGLGHAWQKMLCLLTGGRGIDASCAPDESLQDDAKVCQMSTFLRQKRLNLYGHIRRRDEDNLSRKIMDMIVPGKRRRGRPRRRWIDNNRDMSKYELTADMTENRQYWKMMVKTGPQRSGDGL